MAMNTQMTATGFTHRAEVPSPVGPDQPMPGPPGSPEIPQTPPVEPPPGAPDVPEPSPPEQPDPGAPDVPGTDPKGPEIPDSAVRSRSRAAGCPGSYGLPSRRGLLRGAPRRP